MLFPLLGRVDRFYRVLISALLLMLVEGYQFRGRLAIAKSVCQFTMVTHTMNFLGSCAQSPTRLTCELRVR